MSTEPLLLKGAQVYLRSGAVRRADLLLADGVIREVSEGRATQARGVRVLNLDGFKVAPAFIELHFQGLLGHDVWEGSEEAMRSISVGLARFGVGAFLCTTAWHGKERFSRLVELIENQDLYPGAKPLGIYLESPFVSQIKRGGIPADRLQAPRKEQLDEILDLARGNLRMMTLAPELPGVTEMVSGLIENGVKPAIGHTDAGYEQTRVLIDAGARHVTHLWNAMTALGHRKPGAVVAALLDERVTVETVVDGIHLHPAVVEMTVRLKGIERVSIVTDAVKAAGMPDGDYRFGDGERVVHVRDGAPRLDDGTLAGSTLTMDRAVRNMTTLVGRREEEAVSMAGLSPATVLGLEKHKGVVEAGYDADLVILDGGLRVAGTIVGGEIVYDAGNGLAKSVLKE